MTTDKRKEWAAMLIEEAQYWAARGRPQRSPAVTKLQASLAGLNMAKPTEPTEPMEIQK